MRKSRLKILPARRLSGLGFLLLYLACPVIGDLGRTRTCAPTDLLLLNLSDPDNPGDEEICDCPDHMAGTATSIALPESNCETLGYEWQHCSETTTNLTSAVPVTPTGNMAAEPDLSVEEPLPIADTKDRDFAPPSPSLGSDQYGRKESFRRQSYNVHETRKRQSIKSPLKLSSGGNQRRLAVGTGSETNQKRRRMFGDNSYPSKSRSSRLHAVPAESRRVQRRSSDRADARRVSGEVSLVRRRSDTHSGTRQAASVRSDAIALESRQRVLERSPEHRRLTRRNTKLGTSQKGRHNMRARVVSDDLSFRRRVSTVVSGSRRLTGGIPNTRSMRVNRILTSLPNTRRLALLTSSRLTDSANMYRNARTTSRRLYKDDSVSRKVRLNSLRVSAENLLIRKVSQDSSRNRRVRDTIFKVPRLSTGTLRSKRHSFDTFDMCNTDNTTVSGRMSQDNSFLISKFDSNISKRTVFRDGSINRELSAEMLGTQSVVRRSYSVRSNSEIASDSRDVKYKSSGDLPKTRRLVRTAATSRRVFDHVFLARKISRTSIKSARMAYNLPETRRNAHREFRTRLYSADVSGIKRSYRNRNTNERLSLPTTQLTSRERSFHEANRIITHNTRRRLSFAKSSSTRTSAETSSGRRLGELHSTKRFNHELSLVRRNSAVTSDFRRTSTSSSVDIRRVNTVERMNSRRVSIVRYANTRLPAESTQTRRLVRGMPSARNNARDSFSRKMSGVPNTLHLEEMNIPSLARERYLARKFSTDSPNSRRTSRTLLSKSKTSLSLPDTKRKTRELSPAGQHSADGHESQRSFRATSTNRALHFGQTNTRRRRSFEPNTSRLALAVGHTETSRGNLHRRSHRDVSRKNSLAIALMSRQRYANAELTERINSATALPSKRTAVSSAVSRTSRTNIEHRRLSQVESSRQSIFTNKMRAEILSDGRFTERRHSTTQSNSRNSIINRRNSGASLDRTRFSPSKANSRKDSKNDAYTRRVSSDMLLSRRVRTEEQRVLRTSLTRRYSAHRSEKRMIPSTFSGYKLDAKDFTSSRSSRGRYQTRRTFGRSSSRRSNIATSTNTRVLLKNNMETLSARMSFVATTRFFHPPVHGMRRTTFGNRVFSPNWPEVELVRESPDNMKTERIKSRKPSLLEQVFTTSKISEEKSPLEKNVTAIDVLKLECEVNKLGRSTNNECIGHLFAGYSYLEPQLTTNTSLTGKHLQKCTDTILAYHVPTSKRDTTAVSEWIEDADLFSDNGKNIRKHIPVKKSDATGGDNEVADTEIKDRWYSAIEGLGRHMLSAMITSLPEKLRDTDSTLFLTKFLNYNSHYEFFQSMKEQICQLGIIQVLKNSLVPDVRGIEMSIPPQNDTTGLGVASGVLIGTAVLLKTKMKSQ